MKPLFMIMLAMLTIWVNLQGNARADRVSLIDEGAARAAIVLPAEPQEREQQAAEELIEHLALMTGVALEVVVADNIPDGLLPVYLGTTADGALDALSRAAGENPSTFTLRVRQDRVDIRGLSDEGTLFGVYELLEQLGFRWYIPGDLGRVVPEADDAVVARQTETQAPSMELRLLQPWASATTGWIARQRLGGDRRSTGGHGIPGLPRGDFSDNPEWYSLVGGERRPRQDCLSNPEVLERATAGIRRAAQNMGGDVQYVGAASHDGGGYCECDGCRALDQDVYDPTGDRISMTDRYIWFFNRVLENLEDEFPNLYIVHYTYGAHMMPPAIEMHPRIVPVFAPITIDRIRGMDNPMSPDRHLLRWLIDEYAARGVQKMTYRGYYNNLACVQLPKTQIDRVRNEIPAIHAQGVEAMRVECIRHSWACDPLTLYLAARMMWDVNTDVDAVLEEFYEKFYGPAAAVMGDYHEQLEAAFRDTPYMTGSSYLYFPIFKDHPRRDTLRDLLDEAVKIAERAERPGWMARLTGRGDRAETEADSPYVQRVRMIRQGYERMDLFLDLMQARNRHDFVTAHEKMTAFDEITEAMVAEVLEGSGRWGHRFVSLNASAEFRGGGGAYFTRFFRRPIVTGYERAVSEGEIVATLPDEWMFLLDPAEIGEISGYHRPGKLGGNWQPMKTSTRSWSDQGLHYYKGIAWYRQKVEIPAEYEGRPVYLWFGGVDRLASVWVNGVFMGTSREPREGVPGVPGSFRPFDMPTVREDGASALNFGGENWVVVRIENKSLAELGTGGILAPVMFWSPTDPDWTP